MSNDIAVKSPLELMDGTESKKSFGVFHRSATHKIGIRPLILEAPSGTFIGFRLRVVPRQQSDDNKENFIPVVATAHANQTAFPMFPWGKCDSVRASLMGGVIANVYPGDLDKLKEFFSSNSIARSILTALKGMLNVGGLENEAELSDWLWTKYHQLLDDQAGGHHFSTAADEEYQLEPVPITLAWSITQAEQVYAQSLQQLKTGTAGLLGTDTQPTDPKLLN